MVIICVMITMISMSTIRMMSIMSIIVIIAFLMGAVMVTIIMVAMGIIIIMTVMIIIPFLGCASWVALCTQKGADEDWVLVAGPTVGQPDLFPNSLVTWQSRRQSLVTSSTVESDLAGAVDARRPLGGPGP